jgi:hypothetical protein
MNTLSSKAMLVVAALLVACAAALAKDPAGVAAQPTPAKDSDPFPITVRAAPAVVMAGQPGRGVGAGPPAGVFTLAGDTLPAGQRGVAITISSEAGAVISTLQVQPDARGRYAIAPPVPAQAGTYRVAAVAPDGRGTASASFRVVAPGSLGAQAESVLNDALAAAQDGVTAAEAKIDALPESPPKVQAKSQLADAKQALGELRAAAAGSSVKGIIGAISSDAALQESFRPRLDALTTDLDGTAAETERVKKLTAEMSSADVGCQQLEVVSQVFKGVAALMGWKKRVIVAVGGLAKDFIEASYRSRTAGAAAAPPPASDRPGLVRKYMPEIELATKAIGNSVKFMTALGSYVTSKLFGAYCEQFVGPLEGIMNARFFTSSSAANPLAEWWSYNYKLTGRVILVYPKSAKAGQPVRLTGRIEGYAHGFETWEDALTVTFPKLMAGAVQHKFNYPPIEADIIPSPAGQAAPGSDYVKGSAASLAVPNSFLISVDGVLDKDSMTIVIGQAKSDIDAKHRVAALILSPLVGGLGPQITWYPLPFQKVRPFLVNAADGESMKLSLKTSGDVMQAQGVFTGKIDKPKAKADYTLKIKACNPGC